MYILGSQQMNALVEQLSKLEFIQASTDEAERIVTEWADSEEILKNFKRNFDSYVGGRVAIKYCMLTGCGIFVKETEFMTILPAYNHQFQESSKDANLCPTSWNASSNRMKNIKTSGSIKILISFKDF
jgi:hypothetical protein